MELCSVCLAIVFVGLVLLWFWLTRNRGHLEGLGIPIVPPFLCFGSPPFAPHKYILHELYLERHNKYGKTYGEFAGVVPCVVTIDPEIIKNVTVKNFDSFTDILEWEVRFCFTSYIHSSSTATEAKCPAIK